MWRKSSTWLLLFLVVSVSGSATGHVQSVSESANAPPASVTVPDGTAVELRFAQAVWGEGSGWRPRSVHARAADIVTLVVAADVSVNGQIVISKGSPAQATVRSVWKPYRDRNGVSSYCLCVSLEFDWVRSLDNQGVPLRPTPKAGPFEVDVESTPSGAVATPYSLGRRMEDVALFGFRPHRKDWIPPGTRITAFVYGDATLDDAQISAALEHRPIPNETGLIMIYRTKEQKDARPQVSCDARTIGQVGSRQFMTLEMDPGEHSCRADLGRPLNFPVLGGRDYYFFLHYGTFAGGWELSAVDNGEGEDGVGAAEPINIAPQPAK
jgi:hypothetical protein